MEGTTTTDLLARLEAMAARLDEQAEEIARLRSAVPGAGTVEKASEAARTTTRRGLLTGALAAGVAVTALAAAKATPAHAADPNDVVKGATNVTTATTIISSGTPTAFAGYSFALGVEGVGQSSGTGVRGSSNAGNGADFGGSGTGVEGLSGSGAGVRGVSASGNGVLGSTTSGSAGAYGYSASGPVGVRGENGSSAINASGVKGSVFGGLTNGVWGENSGSGNNAAGVYGTATNTSSPNFGVWGRTYSNSAAASGVYGEVIPSQGTATGVRGVATGGFGVFGQSVGGFGVYGQSTNSFGVFGSSGTSFGCGGASTAPGTAGLFGYSSTAGAVAMQGTHTVPGGTAAFFSGAVTVSGNFQVINGAKNALVRHPDGSHRRMYCQESPEPWFEDFGTATLTNGRAVVDLDPDFDVMVKGDDYLVFTMAEGDCNGLFISRKGPHRFVVEELKGGKSTLTFSYRLVSRRKEDVGKRLEKVQLPTFDTDKFKRQMEAQTSVPASPPKPPKP